MISQGTNRLIYIQKHNSENKNYINTHLYPLLYKTDLWISTYEKLKSYQGSRTIAIRDIYRDSFSREKIDTIIDLIRKEKWHPKSTRGLIIPESVEQIVQEIVRQILEAIYKSSFLETSCGFCTTKSCHNALKQLENQFQGINWVIEGHIIGCSENIPYSSLINVLRKRIRDERFLSLIRKLLKAGYRFNRNMHNSKLGTHQGSRVSPILANIYRNEFDQWIQSNIPEWRKQLKRKFMETPYSKKERKSTRIRYIRYADSWIMGFSGPKSFCIQIKELTCNFLNQELGLELFRVQTKITDISRKSIRFLDYTIHIPSNPKLKILKSKKTGKKFTQRTTGYLVKFKVPSGLLIQRLYTKGFCDNKGFPLAQKKWTNQEDMVIVKTFNKLLYGINNYYAGASDQQPLSRIDYILRWSCAKTLAHKHKSTCNKMFKKYGRELGITINENANKSKKVKLPKRTYQNRQRKWRVNSEFMDPLEGVFRSIKSI